MTAPEGRGRVVAERYRLIRALGAGGMGTVWLGEDQLLRRRVAVKEVLPPAGMTGSERAVLRQRTLREARIAARLNQVNVVTIYDVVEDGDQPWIVMELISARSLRDIVQRDGPLTAQQAAKVALQILAALRAAHALGIVHRDVKPGNVLIESGGRTVLTDFGIARAQDSSAITTSGVLVGSPSYIAPERAHGEDGGPGSDLWSLGATMYSAVEGRPPYDRAGALATLTAAVTQDPDPPGRAGPLWPVIRGLLCRDPAQRLSPDVAERMFREVADMAETPGSEPPLTGPETVIARQGSQAGGTGGLEKAERTRAFHPHASPGVSRPAAAAPAASPPAGASREDAAPPDVPVPGLAAAAPQHARPPDEAAEPVGDARPALRPSSAADAEPAVGNGEPQRPAEQARSAPALPPTRDGGRGARLRWRRLSWLIALAAAVMAAVAASAAVHVFGQHAAPPSAHSGPAPTPASSKSPGSAPPTTRSSPGSAGASTTPPPVTKAVPAGCHRYHDPTGFSIAVPDGWTVSHQGGYVYVTPPSGGSFLLIDQTGHPNPNPLANWQQQEANRMGTYPGYHRIRLQAINYPQAEKAADWEFTYYRDGVLTHVLNRNVLANSRHAYALYWSTRETEWKTDYHYFQVFARTFTPAAP